MSDINVVVVVGGGGVPFFLRLCLCLWRSLYRFLPQQCEFLFFAHYNHYKPSKVIVEALCVDKSCSGGEGNSDRAKKSQIVAWLIHTKENPHSLWKGSRGAELDVYR